jgi:tetratricopeptide (TPR) repeat protein
MGLALGGAFALRRLDDADTFWHLAAGRWIWNHVRIPRTDPFSFTASDHAWINLQWLFDLIVYLIHRAGGAGLLVVASAAASVTAVGLLIKNLRLSLGSCGTGLLTLWILIILQERLLIRPEMLSFIFLGAVVHLLATARSDEGRRLWLLVPIMLVWVNCHALFIVGLFVIACGVGAALVSRLPLLPGTWRAGPGPGDLLTRRMLGAGLSAGLVTLANPYFLDGLLFPLKLLSRIAGSRADFGAIGEFHGPFSTYYPTLAVKTFRVFFPFSAGVVLLAAALRLFPGLVKRRRGPGSDRFDLAGVGILAGLGYLSLLARRNMGLFVVGTAPFVAQSLGVLVARLPEWRGQTVDRLRRVATMTMISVFAAGLWLVASNEFYRWDDQTHETGLDVLDTAVPIRAAHYARELALPPRLYNDLGAGGYLTWAEPVPGGVFIDGRLEVYDTAFFTSYEAGLKDMDLWSRQADALGINSVIVMHRYRSRHPLIRWLIESPRWSLVYYDEAAVVFVRVQGHEAIIRAAVYHLPTWSAATRDRLIRPAPSWRSPTGQAIGAVVYATLLYLMGRPTEAAEYDELGIRLGLSRPKEVVVLRRLAEYHDQRGEPDVARRHLRRALHLDPHNAEIRSDLDRLGG